MISRVYLYNISNYEEIENRVGNDYPKPILQEVGPFTYKEKHFKDEVVFNENGTVTYKTRKQWIFLEDESPSLDSMIVNFNIISMVSSIHFFRKVEFDNGLNNTLFEIFIFVKKFNFDFP